jgi:hypothetical protein
VPDSMQWTAAVWAIGLGALFVATIWLLVNDGWAGWRTDDRVPDKDISPEPRGPITEYPDGLSEGRGRPTTVLILTAVVFVAWASGYALIFLQSVR